MTDALSIARDLLRCPSVTPADAGALGILETILKDAGFEVHRVTFGEPRTADIDNLYSGIEVLLEHVDYVIGSREFPQRITGMDNLAQALPEIERRFGCRVTGATLGRDGALLWDGQTFHYSRAFRVQTVDTTGAGDIFHAAFNYGLLQGWLLDRTLEFACAAAALNCTASGARGGIKTIAEIETLMSRGDRYPAAFQDGRIIATSGPESSSAPRANARKLRQEVRQIRHSSNT